MLAMRARTNTTKPMNLIEATNEARKIQSRHTGSISIIREVVA